jgi:hypothetical protein
MLLPDIRQVGKHLARKRRQNGWVQPTGKARRTWTGFWYEYELVDGIERRRQKSRVLSLRSELTKGDAEEKLRTLLRTTVTPTEDSQRHLLFEEAARKYLQLKKGDWGPKMNSCLQSIFSRHIIPAFGPKLISEIKPSDIKALLNSLAERGCSDSLVRKVITHIRGVFEMLVEDDLLKKNPAKAKTVTKPKLRKPSERFLSVRECACC